MNTCNPLLQRVYETGFALDDVILFLDTNPTNAEALQYYFYMKQLRDEAVNNYEAAYGPLFNFNVNTANWSWINDPWPWEGDC